MKLFSNTRTKRSTALMMLLVWVFALASGIVNACLLEARSTHGHSTAATDFRGRVPPAVSAGHVGFVADHEGDSYASKSTCLKACDDGSLSLVKQASGPDLTDPGLAVAFVRPVGLRVVVASRRTDDLRPAASGPPIRVLYSRLSI